jgi:beta-galactosidase/beta-glucuronidase
MGEKISLDGIWRFCADSENQGIDQQWALQENQPYLENKTRMIVPSCWNRDTWGDYANYSGAVWLWRTLRVPTRFDGKKVYLRFGGVVHALMVFIDGKQIGEFKGAFIPCEFEVPEEFCDHQNHFLALRIDNSPEKNVFTGSTPAKIYGGLVGSVELIAVDELTLEELTLSMKVPKPNYAEIEFQVYLKNAAPQDFKGLLKIELTKDFVPMYEIEREVQVLKQNSRLAKIVMQLDSPELWDLENPILYNLHLTVRAENSDLVMIEFNEIVGIRQIDATENGIQLNGKPVTLNGCGFDLADPQFGFCLPDVMIFDKLAKLKQDGINFIRPQYGLFSQAVIEAASRIGILVVQDIPVVKEREEYFRILIEQIKYLPALVCYSIHPGFNLTQADAPKKITDLRQLFNSRLDPSRPFIVGTFGTNVCK